MQYVIKGEKWKIAQCSSTMGSNVQKDKYIGTWFRKQKTFNGKVIWKTAKMQ